MGPARLVREVQTTLTSPHRGAVVRPKLLCRPGHPAEICNLKHKSSSVAPVPMPDAYTEHRDL
jgi:hypothetical protein